MRFSRRNLGAGEQWGREVEQAIYAGESGIRALSEGVEIGNRQINATLNNLTGLVTTLQEQQEQLSAQQDRLEEQQSQILEVVRNQIRYTADFTNFAGPFNISSASETPVGSLTIPVPAGYTNVTVSATANVGLVNPLGTTSSVGARLYMDWPDGSSNFSALRYQSAGNGWDLALTPILQRSKTGLSGGQFITVRAVLRSIADWPNTPGGFSVNYQAVFTRDL